MPSQELIDQSRMGMAEAVSILSKDPKNKVGCVIFSADGRRSSVGYNGFPAGVEECWGDTEKHEFVIHAEPNALLNAPFDVRGGTCYVTLEPCHKCLGFLINAGITRVVYDRDYNGSCDNKKAKERLLPHISVSKLEKK